jgi:hypothetical protein
VSDGSKYHVFQGTKDVDALWLASAEGLLDAKQKMQQLAAQKPGKYFVFYLPDSLIVASADSTKSPAPKRNVA